VESPSYRINGCAVRGGRLGVVWSRPALAAFAKSKWPMNTRREEEAISAAGHRERGGRGGGGGSRVTGKGFNVLGEVASGPLKEHRVCAYRFAHGAEGGEVLERALGSPTHPLAHRGAWRRRTGRGGSAPPSLRRPPPRQIAAIYAMQCLSVRHHEVLLLLRGRFPEGPRTGPVYAACGVCVYMCVARCTW
jgi:hypothetical protein